MTYQPFPSPVSAFPAGFMRVQDEPHQLFYDPFDSFDVTDRWAAGVSAGGGVAPAVTAGSLTLGSGTTAGGYAYLTSRPSFMPTIPAWLLNSWAVAFESPVGINATRFWGHGIIGGTPTAAQPLGSTGNGYGFELDIAGVLQAVIYNAGTRTVISSLAALQPADANPHRYICFYRTDKIYYYIDGLGAANLAASSNFQGPSIQNLPIIAISVANTTAPLASRVFTCMGMAVSDTGKNNNTLSDGVFGWRKATIKPASTPAAATDTPLVVALHPSSPTPGADAGALFKGRATSFRMVGRAGTTPRRLATVWNPVGSGRSVVINLVAADFVQTAAILVTVIPPTIRVYKITAAPTGGTALTKVAKDSLLTSAAAILLAGDASADGTNSATALTATTTAGAAITQEFMPRLITAAGYEIEDRMEFLSGYGLTLRPGEGICLSADVTLATQEPATTFTIITLDWTETL